jgi:transcription initiation factor TFIID subunit TAF12
MSIFKKWFNPGGSARKVAAAQAEQARMEQTYQQQAAQQQQAIAQQEKVVQKQEQAIAKQEEVADEESSKVAKSRYGRLRAVRRGGSLLSTQRASAETGLTTTLGMGTGV